MKTHGVDVTERAFFSDTSSSTGQNRLPRSGAFPTDCLRSRPPLPRSLPRRSCPNLNLPTLSDRSLQGIPTRVAHREGPPTHWARWHRGAILRRPVHIVSSPG